MTSICSVILAFMLSIGGGANLSVHLSEKPHPGLKIETRELRPIQTELNQEQQPVLRFFIRNSRLGVRFLQTDFMGYEDSLNLYQAFNQNPVNFVDPMGKDIVRGKYVGASTEEREKMVKNFVDKGRSRVELWLKTPKSPAADMQSAYRSPIIHPVVNRA